jgi:hypothetical protein
MFSKYLWVEPLKRKAAKKSLKGFSTFLIREEMSINKWSEMIIQILQLKYFYLLTSVFMYVL